MNMNATIQKLDELLAKVRAQLIEKKGLKEEPIEQPEQADLPQHPDTDYLIKVFNHLKDLGYINTQYEFSEQFFNFLLVLKIFSSLQNFFFKTNHLLMRTNLLYVSTGCI